MFENEIANLVVIVVALLSLGKIQQYILNQYILNKPRGQAYSEQFKSAVNSTKKSIQNFIKWLLITLVLLSGLVFVVGVIYWGFAADKGGLIVIAVVALPFFAVYVEDVATFIDEHKLLN